MKKIAVILMLMLCFTMTAAAEESQIDSFMRASGSDELSDYIDDDTVQNLEKLGIKRARQDDILQITMDGIFGVLTNIIKQRSQGPLRTVFVIIGVILLCSMFKSAQNTFVLGEQKSVFEVVSVLFICAVVLLPLTGMISLAGNLIKTASGFMSAFVPVYTGIIIANGQLITAATYTTVLMGATQAMSGINAFILTPFMSVYFALCLVGSASPDLKISAVAELVKKLVTTVLTFLTTLFIILLSVQSLVSNAGDTMTMKTAKFMSGSFIPFVGGAIAEALSTLSGCMNLIKVTVGSYAIIVLLLIFLPVVVELLLWQLAIHVSSAVSGLFGIDAVTGLLKCAGSAVKVIMSITIMCGVLYLISAVIMITTGMGTV